MFITRLIKNRKRTEKPVHSEQSASACPGLYRFSMAEIKNAINSDSGKRYLGNGSTGHNYAGMLPSGQLVAVKQLRVLNSPSHFAQEIEYISRVRHPNLVCLIGYCIDDGEQYLVYEYCSSGNLAQNLFRKGAVLTWERRVKILRDCAFVLRYLHNHVDGSPVHGAIKLHNILLTADLEPKLSDFGLAKLTEWKGEEIVLRGDLPIAIGYLDPEYMRDARLTSASDIYSFGIVILQVLSGGVLVLDLEAREWLTRKAKDVNLGKRPLTDFLDPRLNGNMSTADFESILQIAVLCVASSSTGRPTIDLVFVELEKAWQNTKTEMVLPQ